MRYGRVHTERRGRPPRHARSVRLACQCDDQRADWVNQIVSYELRLPSLLETMACGVIIQSEDGVVMRANSAAADLLGVPAWQLHGRRLADLHLAVCREDASPLDPSAYPSAAALRSGKPLRNRVVGIQTPDGGRRWLQVDAVPIAGQWGSAPGVESTFVDVKI